MKRIYIMLALFLLGSTASTGMAAAYYLRQHSFKPCNQWSFEGKCTYKSLTTRVPDADSTRSIINNIDLRIKSLEEKVELLIDENALLKNELLIEK